MRRALDALYLGCGVCAAALIVAICAVAAAQIALNLFDKLLDAAIGAPLGLTIPSYADFTGFFLAASVFMAAPYAFRRGAHIRVSLVLSRLSPAAQRWANVGCAALAAAFAAFFALNLGLLVEESLAFNDKSPGVVAVPLWIPQTPLAIGAAVLAIAALDDAIAALRGRTPAFAAQETGDE